MKPTIGRIVHAVIRDARGDLVTRPAIITRTWSDEDNGAVQLAVFPDAHNDGLGVLYPISSAQFNDSPNTKIGNTWNWPPISIRAPHPGKAEFEKLGEELLTLCHEIEELPASEQQTKIVVHASSIRTKLRALCDLL
jgi:hypothetical protein